ncbi:MAG: hypothetical protein ABL958_06555 [Bdellovibrionia bacterium]
MKESLKPLIDQIRVKLSQRDELRETVAKNLSQTRETIEIVAKEAVRQTKNSKWVAEYVRPAVESQKAEDALTRLEEKISQSGPLVAKLREIRKQFLDATKPAVGGKAVRKKKTGKSVTDSADA